MFEIVVNILRIIVLTTCAIYGMIQVYKVTHKPPLCDTCKKLEMKRKRPNFCQYKYYCECKDFFDRAPEICSKYEKREDNK